MGSDCSTEDMGEEKGLTMGSVCITVDVEEWFHTQWINVPSPVHEKAPTDIVETTETLLELFAAHDVEATFFILGETAFRYPEVVDSIERENHEIACHGYSHTAYETAKDFQKDIQKFKRRVKQNVAGFRIPNFDVSTERLRIIKREGFLYDSSVVPCWKLPGWYGKVTSPVTPYDYPLGNNEYIREFPLAVLPFVRLPGAGGWFLRNFGYSWVQWVLKSSLHRTGIAVFYVHPWEISYRNPSHLTSTRMYHMFRNTGDVTLKRITKLVKSFSEHHFCALGDLDNL